MSTRRKPKPIIMDEVLKKRLDDQDTKMEILLDHINQAMDLLKGSSIMDYPGLIQSNKKTIERVNDIDAKVQHIERWRQVQIAKKGTFTFKTADLFTKVLTIIGGVSLAAGTIYTIIQIVILLTKE